MGPPTFRFGPSGDIIDLADLTVMLARFLRIHMFGPGVSPCRYEYCALTNDRVMIIADRPCPLVPGALTTSRRQMNVSGEKVVPLLLQSCLLS